MNLEPSMSRVTTAKTQRTDLSIAKHAKKCKRDEQQKSPKTLELGNH